MKKCLECEKKLNDGKVVDVTNENNVSFVIINVPCMKCECGERYFSVVVSDKISNIIDKIVLKNTTTDLYIVNFENEEVVYVNE